MIITDIIEEQSVFAFTGRVNILLEGNKQYVGAIILRDGKIVHAEIDDKKGKKALFDIAFQYMNQSEKYHCVIEPELIAEDIDTLDYSSEEFSSMYQKLNVEYEEIRKFSPPLDLKLLVNPEFILQGDQISGEEFDLLGIISDYPKISDIYQNTLLHQLEVNRILISLRKKSAVRVVK